MYIYVTLLNVLVVETVNWSYTCTCVMLCTRLLILISQRQLIGAFIFYTKDVYISLYFQLTNLAFFAADLCCIMQLHIL